MVDSEESAISVKLERDKTLGVSRPSPGYPSISITGGKCDLECPHCEGLYLNGMMQADEPEALYETLSRLSREGARGALLSGGFNRNGYVPFSPYLDVIKKIKDETDLYISVHPGLMPGNLVKDLARAGVDMASFDLVGDDSTIELISGIDKTTENYRETLEHLVDNMPRVVPHICLGLHEGVLKGESKALEIAGNYDISALVFLVLRPTPGTPFEEVEPPSPEKVGAFISKARVLFPEIPLSLGCMRPRGEMRTDYEIKVLEAGIDRIELPSPEALEKATDLGLEPKEFDACCAVPEELWK